MATFNPFDRPLTTAEARAELRARNEAQARTEAQARSEAQTRNDNQPRNETPTRNETPARDATSATNGTESPETARAAAAMPAEPTPIVRHDDVVARVRELLGKYPNVGSRQLFDLAIRMHPDLEQTGFRSFHARYVLPLKREKARAEGRMPKPRTRKVVAAAAPPPDAAEVRRTRRSRLSQPDQATQAAATPSVPTPLMRSGVREVLLRLARNVAIAETRADLIDALARVEDMVDEVVAVFQPRQPDDQQQPLPSA